MRNYKSIFLNFVEHRRYKHWVAELIREYSSAVVKPCILDVDCGSNKISKSKIVTGCDLFPASEDIVQAAADDFYAGMKWIFETPNWEYRNLTHYNEYSSWGIEFSIFNSKLSKETVKALNSHYNDLITLNIRY